MSIIPGAKVDFMRSPRIVTIPVPGTPVDISIEDLQDTLQDIEDDPADGILYPRLRDCEGGKALGPGRFVGYTLTLLNAQIMFEGQTTAKSDGAATADDPAGTILTDLSATFVVDGVLRGATVVNWTTRAMSVVTEVISETQLRHVQLSGGSRTTWLTNDEYGVYLNVKCGVVDGNIVAVDDGGNPIDPIMSSPNTFAQTQSATSAALLEGSGGVTAEECATAVLEAAVVGRPPGSLGATVEQTDQDVLDVAGEVANVGTQVSGVGDQVAGVAGQVDGVADQVTGVGIQVEGAADRIEDVIDTTDDLHDEAFGKWVLNPSAATLTLYRQNGDVLRTFNLKVAAGNVPAFVERVPT